MGFIIFPIALAAVVVGFIMAQRRMRAVHAAWGRAAQQLGLRAAGGGWSTPRLEGRLGGVHVVVDVYSTGGKNKTYYTRYKARFPQRGVAIRLKRQSGLSRVTKFFGATDVEIGDMTFDDAFMIKEDSAARAAQYLTITRRTLLLRLYSLYRSVELTPDDLEIVIRGYEDQTDDLVTTTRRLVSAARVLAGLAPEEAGIERSLRRRRDGDMRAAADELAQITTVDEDVETRLLEADVFTGAGELDRAEPILRGLADQLPGDEEVAGLQRAIQRMEPTTPAPDQSQVDMEELLEDLFVSNRLSFETTEIFDEHYLGRRVSWSGKVLSVRDYESDMDFGDGPGSKVVVAIAEVEHDLYGVAEVDAVVSVPPGTASRLTRGDQIEFSGKLHRADSMMRNIFVADAEIL